MKPTKSWFHCSSVWSRSFFPLTFFRFFITDIAVVIFINMQEGEVKFTMTNFPKQNAEKPDIFLPGEQKSFRHRLLVHVSL